MSCSAGGPQYAFFLTPAAVVDRDTFTVAYLRVAGASELMSYSNEYKELIDASRDASSRFASAARRSARAA
ncbi:MAG: hypothetical protein ACLVKA_05725 [Collinsella aerofaciens]